ncbi:sulfotransferase [Halobacillus sp. BBL2006]|uniref:sulfotransferase n=1 Tax=Halobacillus sp. BBL2006 TaxID=1543706 RepID=UPI000B22DE03|nr:sulfotransferase [Halobacillus sp. BBL2006]
MKTDHKPILITGAPRGGTTFVGKMLSLSPEVGYIHEPFNKEYGLKNIKSNFQFLHANHCEIGVYESSLEQLLLKKGIFKRIPISYLLRGNKSIYKRLMNFVGWTLIKSRPNYIYKKAKLNPLVKRFLIKDPMLLFSTEWIVNNYDFEIVMVVRHPAAFVSSLKRLNWQFDFHTLKNQRELLETYPTLRQLLEEIDEESLSNIEKWAFLWNCYNSFIYDISQKYPSIKVVRHEDLSKFPIEEFEKLYKHLNINFTEKIKSQLKVYTGEENPTNPIKNNVHTLKRNSRENVKRWKSNLSKKEISEIKEITNEVSNYFYDDSDW